MDDNVDYDNVSERTLIVERNWAVNLTARLYHTSNNCFLIAEVDLKHVDAQLRQSVCLFFGSDYSAYATVLDQSTIASKKVCYNRTSTTERSVRTIICVWHLTCSLQRLSQECLHP